MSFTASSSTFTFTAGSSVNVTATFLSPLTPNDPMRQSLPYSYLTVSVNSTDGKTHRIQLYSDVGAQFVSGADLSPVVRWNTSVVGDLLVHQSSMQTAWPFGEIKDYTTAGTFVYGVANVCQSWQTFARFLTFRNMFSPRLLHT